MMKKFHVKRELPAEILDDDRSWQGDHDPYLATLAHEGHLGKAPAPQRGPRLSGPADDGDPYLAELTRLRRDRPA
jgi:hypothetical protein